jgi:hypothetical protein
LELAKLSVLDSCKDLFGFSPDDDDDEKWSSLGDGFSMLNWLHPGN